MSVRKIHYFCDMPLWTNLIQCWVTIWTFIFLDRILHQLRCRIRLQYRVKKWRILNVDKRVGFCVDYILRAMPCWKSNGFSMLTVVRRNKGRLAKHFVHLNIFSRIHRRDVQMHLKQMSTCKIHYFFDMTLWTNLTL